MNNLTPSSTGSFITFRGFDKEIEAYLEPKIPLSHKLINQVDIPLIVDSLREYLIRSVGCFTISGFYRPNDLSIWYDREAIIEEFDDLRLLFRDWLFTQGVDIERQYTLSRFRDNLNFIMIDGVRDVEPEVPSIEEEESITFKYAKEDVEGFLHVFGEHLTDKCDYIDDGEAFVKDLIASANLDELVRRHMFK